MKLSDLRAIAILIVFLIFTLPFLIHVLTYTFTSSTKTQPDIEDTTELIQEAAVPWWIGIFQWIINVFGSNPWLLAILVIGFIYFLKWIKEI
jgi:hypothetical protein